MSQSVNDGELVLVCDGCARELRTGERVGNRKDDTVAAMVGEVASRSGYVYDPRGLMHCAACAERRDGDPTVTVAGRALTVSELHAQAEHDEGLRSALDGDTVQEAIKAAKSRR